MIHLVVRTFDGGNLKDRPHWFNKDLCLWSIARAWACVTPKERGEAWIINDGPWPDRWQEIAASMGAVLDLAPLRGQWNSFGRALGLLDRRAWAPQDTVLFVEDDYLVMEPAFEAIDVLHRSAGVRVTYSSIYAPALSERYADDEDRHLRPRHWIGGRQWMENDSTTHTFAATVDVIRTDQWLFRLAIRAPATAGLVAPGRFGTWESRDQATFRALLGDKRVKIVHSLTRQSGRNSGVPIDRDVLLAGRPIRRILGTELVDRTLLVPVEAIATHSQEGFLTDGHDWEAEAASVLDWRTTVTA